MSGWYFVYLLMAGINGAALAGNGYFIGDWQFWLWMTIPIIAYIAGREVERGK